ncbi:hypothetical protein FRB91_003256 [Serendipita sp. 411]|nr:hypothetical protein FRC19_010784 [Serendipita sp. 401]KAG8819276.1 hypothetical protein FRC18_012139 [Serendipita sp. 400]KAG8843596.1 hypothetical protein FRB91_003256 [Serendipita sp. 411]KAG9052177.1 hypothetical protein FS842_010384 [Serendipita sp. 407]
MPEPENDIYSFNCCFEEEDDSFRVDVPKQLTIEELRMEIHKKRPMSDPYRVKVYKCAIPLCHGFVKEMKTLLQGPEAGESRLLMSWKIREHFLEAPKTGLLHIIVQKSHISESSSYGYGCVEELRLTLRPFDI